MTHLSKFPFNTSILTRSAGVIRRQGGKAVARKVLRKMRYGRKVVANILENNRGFAVLLRE